MLFAGFIGFSYPGNSYRLNLLWELFCLLVSLVGLCIRIIVSGTVPAGTSGRNTREQKAETLNTTGLYSVIRHPLYLGNFFVVLGVSLVPRQWYLPVIVSLAFIVYYERIMIREEAFLEERFGNRFRAWANEVPAVVPKFSGYRPSLLPFSFKAAIKKEFHSVLSITAIFFIMDLIGGYVVRGRLVFDPLWASILLFGLSFYIIMLFLKKLTKLLEIEGR